MLKESVFVYESLPNQKSQKIVYVYRALFLTIACIAQIIEGCQAFFLTVACIAHDY
jgi:hypothetical protein